MGLNDFYRQKRPEYFSDSTVESETTLPKETLEFQLAQISKDQKQDEFETLVRRLLEKFVCPNLIPQVGPTGGGDGKTDIESHSVSSFVSERWFIPENGWDQGQKWAFAVSSKEDWGAKVKSDVAKIIATGRGYTKVFFITNQKPSSKKKKDLQDKFKSENSIEVEILDREWLLAKIYDCDALNIAIDSLNLSASYRQIKKVGPRDAERLEKLEILEKQIENPNRYFEYDFQLVDDALQTAILSRMLEKPKDEVLGRFDRALRLCSKLNSDKLRLKIHYQRAWTLIHWYDDLGSFIDDYKAVRQLVGKDATIQEVELLNNLYTILFAQLKVNPQDSIKIKEETDNITNILDIIAQDIERPSSSLVAKTMKILNSSYYVDEKDISSLFMPLKEIFHEAKHHLDFPFETYSKSVQLYGDIFPNNAEYDELIDVIAEISSERDSEISSAMVYVKRAFQKFENKLYKESLVFFGKSLCRLAKDETEEALYLVLRGLSESYENIGLPYAAYCSQIAATHFALKEWFIHKRFNKKIFNCVHRLAGMELMAGRIPHFLLWRELLEILAKQINLPDDEHTEKVILLDSLLAIKLLHSDATTAGFSKMPDILEREELWISTCSALYKLGYVEKAINEISDTILLSKGETIESIIRKIFEQPAGSQLPPVGINFFSSERVELHTKVLGCNIIFNTPNDKSIIVLLEGLLAYIESFFATSLKQFAPYVSEITINVRQNETITTVSITQPNEDKAIFELELSSKSFSSPEQSIDYISVCASLLRFFIGDDMKSYIERLYEDEEFHQRIAMLPSHSSFLRGIIGDNSKILLQDWSRVEDKDYPFVSGWNDHLAETTTKGTPLAEESLIHSNTSVLSVINMSLWDKSKWIGLAIAHDIDVSELIVLLPFENIEAGKMIFEEWRENIGVRDLTNKIKIAIIQGINKDHPAWYRVQIYSEPSKDDAISDRFFITTSRMHTMIPDTTTNIDGLKVLFKRLGVYKLCPVQMYSNNRIGYPLADLSIEKTDIQFLNAWEIGVNSIHQAAILDEDDPIIPDNIENPPIVELLRAINNSRS